MATSSVMLASPAVVEMTMSGKDITIMSADLNFSVSNGSCYKRSVGGTGGDDYLISKGTEIATKSDITVRIVQAPGSKGVTDSLKAIDEAIKLTGKKTDPKDYTKDFVFVVSNSDKKDIVKISFKGFIKESLAITPEKGFTTHEVQIVVYDAATLQFLT